MTRGILWRNAYKEAWCEGFRKGYKIGCRKASLASANALLALRKLTLEEISFATRLPLAEVKRLALEMDAKM